ncbi:MAG TPA: DUF6191 domain-containing protein [Jatrophihabitantaceae bacterium]
MTQWGLDTLFNPAKRHMDEEKRRLQSTREEVGDSSGGRRIDLESGKVSIPKHKGSEDAEDTVAGEDGERAEASDGAVTATKKPPADESPARARARARRARK